MIKIIIIITTTITTTIIKTHVLLWRSGGENAKEGTR